MNPSLVLEEIATRMRTIVPRTEVGFAGKVNPPAAVVYPPDSIDFDLTYGRGLDRLNDVIVVVFVGRSGGARAALAAINPFICGAGALSVKAKLDSAITPYVNCSDLQVERVELDGGATIAGTDLMAALFHCKISGPGA